ncbi:MAG: type IV secretion system DNA-binding domain-containing protein [Candidatus Pacebacteria bacterium]|nr:type IV secretion system DNA-binding domain-containing protein [Candidatus Paceibacterota bacterium]
MDDQDKITYFAQTDFRNKKANFGIKAKDRTRHVYVIGKTGMGKSTLLENMAAQDIMNGEGMAFIDPHGSAVTKLLEYVPEDRIKDVVYFAPFDTEFPISFNVLEDVGADKRHLIASGLMSSFKKIWVDAWSARMEYILNNILLALLEYPGATLLGVNRMLADKDYRKTVVDNIKDPSVKSFWVDEFAKYGDRYMQEAGASIQNKVGQFVSNPLIRNIIGQEKSSFDIRKMMDDKKILLINLSKGQIGESNANLLGGLLITKIYLAAMSRADVSGEMMKRLPSFYLYVDEFQSFASDSFADILSEARKYNLSLNIAHQYVEQMSEAVRAAVFGNVGTMIVFRVGAVDSEIFEKEFTPQFTAEDIVNLGLFQNYMRLMIDGVGSKPFSAVSMAPIPSGHRSFTEEIIESSRLLYARKRDEVEAAIFKWHEPMPVEKKERIVRDSDSARGDRSDGARGDSPRGEGTKIPFGQRPLPPKPFAGDRPMQADRPIQHDRTARSSNAYTVPNAPVRPIDRISAVMRKDGASPSAQTVRPPVRSSNVQKEYVEPVRPKESLQTLLNKLSIEPERPKIEIPQEKPESSKPETVTYEIKKTEKVKSETTKTETISLSSLKKSRTPDAQKIADLRALLQKVVPQQNNNTAAAQPPLSQSQSIAEPQPISPPQKSTENKENSSKTAVENPKEVPEDVLRSILSS